LIKERPSRHEVSGVNDYWRQKYEEERASVELVVVAVSSVGQVQYHTYDNSQHDQQTAFRHRLQQLLPSVVRYTMAQLKSL